MNMRSLTLAAAAVAAVHAAPAAQAAIISTTPYDNPAVAVSPAFGPLAPGGAVGANYIATGIDFTPGNVEGVFDDTPPLAFAGVNGLGDVDLLSPVDGRIVLLGTLTQAVTNYLYAEAGLAPTGSLTLQIFDIGGNSLGSLTNQLPLGANGRTAFAFSTPGIASFSIFGADTFGVDEIRIETPTPLSPVPEPATWATMILGLGAVGAMLRRRRLGAPVPA